jgi:hypothetical protein
MPTSGVSKRLDAWCVIEQRSGVVVRRDVPGQLVVERRMFTSSRALLAAVLLFLAYFPLDYVVRAWLYFSEVATPEEWRQAYSGFALSTLAGLVPTAFAWVLLLRRRSIAFDLAQRQLTAVRDDRIYTRRRRYAFADVTRVTVSRDHPRRQEVTFPVALVMRDGSEVVVSDAPGKAQARATAKLVADVVGVEVTANTSE